MKNPIQPIVNDEHGTPRFKANAIVRYLLDNGGLTMNDLARQQFTDDDRMQFVQLIGYSVSGGTGLSYFDDVTKDTVYTQMEEGTTEEQARIQVLEAKLKSIKELMRDGVAELYEIHPDDLGGRDD